MMTFCEECHDMVAYLTEDIMMEKVVKGKFIKFEGRRAYCPTCKNDLYVDSIHDYNLTQLDAAYRKAEKLITVEEILSLLEMYDIGKRPLACLLGWGEVTLNRYVDGAIPTRNYSNTLFEILNDSKAFENLLEKNRDAISDVAYNKSKAAISHAQQSAFKESADENKIESVAKYLLLNLKEVTPLALQKLLYYSQGFVKVFKGKYLFKNDCEAWVHGPVYADVYHKYKRFGCDPIDVTMPFNMNELNITSSEKEVLDSVINHFGCYSGKVLEKMTHSESPWLETRAGLSDSDLSKEVIQKDLIASYFEKIKQKYDMLNTSDIKDYSRDLFFKLAA